VREGDGSPASLTCGVAFAPMPGEDVCGDQHLVMPTARGYLVAVVDGLGHGPEAAAAAELAVDVLQRHSDEPVLTLVQRCHENLRRTRGVAMSVVTLDAQHASLDWVGVGNVEARLLRALPATEATDEVLLLRGGVVGYQLPALHSAAFALLPGDTLVMATDGVEPRYSDGLERRSEPQPLADDLLAEHGRQTDDALVLVVRYGRAVS
jgi:negative regulator of sigma-B (phosphoserine phosphatase)